MTGNNINDYTTALLVVVISITIFPASNKANRFENKVTS